MYTCEDAHSPFFHKKNQSVMNRITLILVSLLFQSVFAVTFAAETLTSPSGRLSFRLSADGGTVTYRLDCGSRNVILPSKLGMSLRGVENGRGYRIADAARSSHDDIWKEVWGEETYVRNNYNELSVSLIPRDKNGLRLRLIVRLFDDGLGFRYEIPSQRGSEALTVTDELTEFALPAATKTWSYNAYTTENNEAIYRILPVEKLDTVATPLTMETPDNLYLSIHEANLTDYARVNLACVNNSNVLKADLVPWSTGEKVRAVNTLVSPWRTVIVADKPSGLLLSRIMLNLNDPCRIDDTSWIRPGRYIGIWWAIHKDRYTWSRGPKHGATTGNIKRYMDFAAENGFSSVLAEGWNVGWDGDWGKNGSDFRFSEPTEDCNLGEVVAYGKKLGVGFIAHAETGGAARNLENQMEEAFSMYERLGINTLKTGYVNRFLDGKEYHDGQYGVRHYRKVLETAAKYHIMVDAHEPVMPTGLQRTYPNMMTQEAVRGQEYNAWSADGGNPPSHVCTLPFTRGLAGPMDYTPGVLDHTNPVHPKTMPGTTNAAEAALSVILYSPLQMAADLPENYEGHPALEFIRRCPTTWDKTVVPEAAIGEYVTIARKERDGSRWFLGAVTCEKKRTTDIPLDFLDEGCEYKAYIYADGPDAHYRNNPCSMRFAVKDVNASSRLSLDLAEGGGAAVIITKK